MEKVRRYLNKSVGERESKIKHRLAEWTETLQGPTSEFATIITICVIYLPVKFNSAIFGLII